ncbi:MAG: hypothetical protein LBV20_04260 [Treponema sp.]|jgi:hypothetical protein|nr:hypothetical protein [Treponema sp.]
MNVFSLRKFLIPLVLMLIIAARFSYAQENTAAPIPPIDPASYVGMTLETLSGQLGLPRSVHAVRGNESWQDDVVFIYPSIEVYIFKDRVWQVCPVSVYNMKIGDSIDQLKTAMGEPLLATAQYLLYQLPSQAWPMMLRINVNPEGKAASFFIYRSDF